MGWLNINGNWIGRHSGKSWSSYWATRKIIPIMGSSGAGTNYQIMIEVNSGIGTDLPGVIYLNDESLDFPNDMAFTSLDGITQIPFWIDPILGSATKKYVWVRPTANLDSDTYIYIYYGRSGWVSRSNGKDTFNFYEDFEDAVRSESVENATTVAQLSALFPPVKYASNPIISVGSADWKNFQISFPCVIINPSDPSKLLMFVTGYEGTSASVGSIGKFTADISNPYVWTEYGSNPVLEHGSAGQFDYLSVMSSDEVIYNPDDGLLYMFYTGRTTGGIDSIGLATSDDLGDTWTKRGVVLTPTGEGRNDGTHVSTSGVTRVGDTWYMLYAYRDVGLILPGARCATSPNGLTWTKVGDGDIISLGSAGSFDNKMIEGGQLIYLDKWFYLYNTFNDVDYLCTPGIAYSDNFTSGWTKFNGGINSVWGVSGIEGEWDKRHISTVKVYKIGSKWYAFYCATPGLTPDYNVDTWNLGIATLQKDHIYTNLNGEREWVANHVVAVTDAKPAEGSVGVQIRGTNYTLAGANHVIGAMNTIGCISFYMGESALSDLGGIAGQVALLEGADVITSCTIYKSKLQHSISTGSQDIQTITADTLYKITIVFPSKTSHLVFVNDVLQSTLTKTNFNDITDRIDKLVFRRVDKSWLVANKDYTSYFDLFVLREYMTLPPLVGKYGLTINNYETLSYITGLTTPLSEGQIMLIDTLISDIKSGLSISFLSDVFDVMYILAGETEESSLKNIVKNEHHCTNVHSTAFVPLEGFKGDGANDHLSTNYNPAINAINLSINSNSLGIYIRTNDNGTYGAIGSFNGSTNNYFYIYPRISDVFYYSSFSNANGSVANTDSRGMFINSRTAVNLTTGYKNGNPVDTDATVTTAISSRNIYICGVTNAATGAVYAPSVSQISFAFIGRGLTDSEAAALTTAFESYMDAIGKGVIT